ncbi:HEPN domain-containing protein [Rhodocista pekingensis]|uniref:HEPN domain-containing protein n=1 Tax=Rhodocista pekingensis TaxID=201185 RepID=A0ABW2KWJ3_9PROT
MTTGPSVQLLLARAEQTLAAARYTLAGGFAGTALNRAYCAMFYAASAALAALDLFPRTHAGVRTLLGQRLVLTGRLSLDAMERYSAAFAARMETDYSGRDPSEQETRSYVEDATLFLAEIRALLAADGR